MDVGNLLATSFRQNFLWRLLDGRSSLVLGRFALRVVGLVLGDVLRGRRRGRRRALLAAGLVVGPEGLALRALERRALCALAASFQRRGLQERSHR